MKVQLTLDQIIELVSTMGQLTQIRIWLQVPQLQPPATPHMQLHKTNDGYLIIIEDLDRDVIGGLAKLLDYLDSSIKPEDSSVGIDLEDSDGIHSLHISGDGELSVIHTSIGDKERLQQRMMVEWIKRIRELVPVS